MVEQPFFAPVAAYSYPDMPLRQIVDMLFAIKNIDQLQSVVMRHCVEQIISSTMTHFSYDLSPEVVSGKPYLFVSNHRDITLDAMLLDYVLLTNGIATPQIMFGSNLLGVPFMGDFGRLNKMVSIERGGTPHEFYTRMNELSSYIRTVETDLGESVWLAQRNGRTKDGLDQTDPAVVKMLMLSNPGEPVQALAQLNIVPCTISYEWEPCDLLKTKECCLAKREKYVKAPDEDAHSVISGIKADKGHVHLVVGKPLSIEEIEATHGDARSMAALLDSKINAAYRIHASSRVASWWLQNGRAPEPSSTYPQDTIDELHRRLEQLQSDEERTFLLGIYASPLSNQSTTPVECR